MKKAYISNKDKGGYNITIICNKNTNYYFVKLNKKTGEMIRNGRCDKPKNMKDTKKIKWTEVPVQIRKMNFRDLYKGPFDPVKFNLYVYGRNTKNS